MSRRFDGKPDPQERAEATSGGSSGCCAHGCPLPGAFSDSLVGGGPYRCYLHEQVDADLWQAVTKLARERAWMVALLNAVSRDYSAQWQNRAANACKAAGRESLGPKAGESRVAYSKLIREALRNECIPKDIAARSVASGEKSELSSVWKAVQRAIPEQIEEEMRF